MQLSRSAALTGYLDLARSVGLDPYRIVAEQRLPAACLTDPDLRIASDAVINVLETSAERSGVEDFGLRLAETRRLSNLGAVGLLAREQPTLREALEAICDNLWVQTDALSVKLEKAGEVVVFRANVATRLGRAGRQAVELACGVMVRTIRALAGGDWRPQGVLFMHGAPTEAATHRRVLGVTPLFEQELDGVILLARELDIPIPSADSETRRHMERYLAQVAGRRRNDPVTDVRALILEVLPSGQCSAERIASRLLINRRTLHRQLALHGTTFTRLLDDAKLYLAESRLGEGHRSLTEISELLGYSSLSAFSRWYHRRQGLAASVSGA